MQVIEKNDGESAIGSPADLIKWLWDGIRYNLENVDDWATDCADTIENVGIAIEKLAWIEKRGGELAQIDYHPMGLWLVTEMGAKDE